MAGSTARAATTAGRPHTVTLAYTSPTRSRAPPRAERSTRTTAPRSSPVSPAGIPVGPFHTTTGSAGWPASGAATRSTHVDPSASPGTSTRATARPPSSVTVVALA